MVSKPLNRLIVRISGESSEAGEFEVVSIALHNDLTIITYAMPFDLEDDTGDCEYKTIVSDSSFFDGLSGL